MGTMASQIPSLTIVRATIYAGADERKYQSSVSLASVRGIHRCPVNSPHKGPVTRTIFPFDDVIMLTLKADCFLANIWIARSMKGIQIIVDMCYEHAYTKG